MHLAGERSIPSGIPAPWHPFLRFCSLLPFQRSLNAKPARSFNLAYLFRMRTRCQRAPTREGHNHTAMIAGLPTSPTVGKTDHAIPSWVPESAALVHVEPSSRRMTPRERRMQAIDPLRCGAEFSRDERCQAIPPARHHRKRGRRAGVAGLGADLFVAGDASLQADPSGDRSGREEGDRSGREEGDRAPDLPHQAARNRARRPSSGRPAPPGNRHFQRQRPRWACSPSHSRCSASSFAKRNCWRVSRPHSAPQPSRSRCGGF